MKTHKLYYFPKKFMLCNSEDEVNFYCINGDFTFELHSTTGVLWDGKEFEVGDYEEHTRESFNRCYPGFGY